MNDYEKTYTLWEALKELNQHPRKVFRKSSDGVILSLNEGYLMFNTEFTHLNINDRWIPVVVEEEENYVSLNEAIRSGKRIKYKSWNNFYPVLETFDILYTIFDSKEADKMISKNFWMIEN